MAVVSVPHYMPELPADVRDVRALLLVVLTFSLASLVARSNHGNSKSLYIPDNKVSVLSNLLPDKIVTFS